MANIQFATDEGDLRTRLSNAKMVERHYYLEGGLWDGGMHTFAPRASFAWDPTNQAKMSIRGGIGRSYDRMSNQIWDSGVSEPAAMFATVSATVQDPIVRPVFGLGQNTEVPYDYPRPTGLTAGLNRARRAAEWRGRGACGRLRYRADVSGQLVHGGAAIALAECDLRGGLHRVARPQRLPKVGRQPVQRQTCSMAGSIGSCRGLRHQLHRFERSEFVPRRDVLRPLAAAGSQLRWRLHDRAIN